MQTYASLAVKDSSKMKRRAENCAREFSETQFVTKSASEHDSCGIDKIAVRLPSASSAQRFDSSIQNREVANRLD
jgi:hypothetical protein